MFRNDGLSGDEYFKVNIIIRIFHVLLCVVGIISNIVAICVFSRPNLKKFSFSFYSRVLALSDSMLLSILIMHVIKELIDTHNDITGGYFCSCRYYLAYVLGTNSLWLLALISIDRLTSIAYPNRFELLKKRWFQLVVLLLIGLYSVIVNYNIPVYFQYETIELEVKNATKLICYLPIERQIKHSWITLINFVLVNIVINNILTCKLVFIVANSRKKTRQNVNSRDVKFSICSIGLNFTSFISRTPIPLGFLLSGYFDLSLDQLKLVFNINVAIATFDHSLNFFINLFLNSIFYREFLLMIGIKKRRHFIRS